ncbi:LysR family transcriptional regulator [Nocardiopsis terrae]|uniref:DNA-binding transcriptional LysR family regulator n=1 Tax=Nocardiopsis terrae TaxID=372655 RepID=A0ABR9HI68_9ACTN|nr:LysR family transcriptional regulator [Nocardiopsis terrae]MBE1458636.1 DNA-binding transcriptional LysR family regulator [Nocardiopsis terrae]GHC79341.1 LysR family transcriptional regulator [Nocardiopsis terrae]
MNIANLDLNLLVVLRALLEERNVTRAGERIGLSQPATSASLARLRRHFSDELLVRRGNRYELTPLGHALRGPAANACSVMERLFSSRAHFHPETEQRDFTLLASDYAITVFGAALSRALHTEAPGVRLHFRQMPPTIVEATESVLGSVDGVLMLHGVISGYPAVELYRDEWVCLVDADNGTVGEEITMEDLARLPWAVYQRPYDVPVAHQLGMLGLDPRVEVSAHSFRMLPDLVRGTHRVALVQRRLLGAPAEHAGLRALPCPFPAAPIREALWWHPVHRYDAAHTWLRETAARVAAELDPGAAQAAERD